jgi:hypothetical protein
METKKGGLKNVWIPFIKLPKSRTLSDDLFLCQVSKGPAVRFEFNIFCTLVTMATAAILNFFNPAKSLSDTFLGNY